MAKHRLYQVDAFTNRVFSGNPAAVVPLDTWLEDKTLQAIAFENNLAETAFFVPEGSGFRLRWFTPKVEAKLCGHATLASAHVLFTALQPGRTRVAFETLSGTLTVEAEGDRLVMDFPRWSLDAVEGVPPELEAALRATPTRVLSTGDGDCFLAVFETEQQIRSLAPNFPAIARLKRSVIVTALGERSDCVCRFFAPSHGVDEDHATGSIQCALVPYWAERHGKKAIHSTQLSPRGAELFGELRGDRVAIAGQAVSYLEGWIDV